MLFLLINKYLRLCPKWLIFNISTFFTSIKRKWIGDPSFCHSQHGVVRVPQRHDQVQEVVARKSVRCCSNRRAVIHESLWLPLQRDPNLVKTHILWSRDLDNTGDRIGGSIGLLRCLIVDYNFDSRIDSSSDLRYVSFKEAAGGLERAGERHVDIVDLRNSEREGKEGGKGVAVKGSYASDDDTDNKRIDRSAFDGT